MLTNQTGKVMGFVAVVWGIVCAVSRLSIAVPTLCCIWLNEADHGGMPQLRRRTGEPTDSWRPGSSSHVRPPSTLTRRAVLIWCRPGLGLMTPLWWTLEEQPVRHLTWYCFNGVAGIIGGLVS